MHFTQQGEARKVSLIVACTVALVGLQGALVGDKVHATGGFSPSVDHFKVYDVQDMDIPDQSVLLTDQFQTNDPQTLTQVDFFQGQVSKDDGIIFDQNAHHLWFRIAVDPQPPRQILVQNQFGLNPMTIGDAQYVLVPAQKEVQPPPFQPDHYKCYEVLGGVV